MKKPFNEEEAKSWMREAYHALRGAQVLVRAIAECKVEDWDLDSVDEYFDNHDNGIAINDAIRNYPKWP
jgi:hypothetical protein